MILHVVRIIFFGVLSSLVLTACTMPAIFEDNLETPPAVVLSTEDGQEQKGRLGTYCWGNGCADMMGTPFPDEPVTVHAGDTIQLDFGALGTPREVNIVIYEYDAVVQTKGDFTLIMPDRSRHGPPTLEDTRPGTDQVDVSLAIAPGHYVLQTGSWHSEGDSFQGFRLIVE